MSIIQLRPKAGKYVALRELLDEYAIEYMNRPTEKLTDRMKQIHDLIKTAISTGGIR